MRSKLLACGVLTMIALSALGARCYRITWETPEDEDAFGAAVWRELVLAKGEYRFTPAYAVTERLLGRCGEHPADEELVRRRGGPLCQAYVLDVDTPGGTETLGIVGELLAMFGPIESDEEAASLIRATVGGFATYDGATAVAGDEFLVRVDDLRHNCTPTAAFYKIVYAVRRDGDARIVGEEPARREHQGGGICYD